MADIGSMSMVSYYQPLGLYRQQQQAIGQQQLAQHAQQQSQAQQAQQHAASSSPDGPQQYWYGYPPAYPHAAHHHQAPGQQQYLDHPDAFPGWTHHHAHHYSQLQYQHHQAYHQQQQQSSQISAATDWSGDEGNPVVVAGEPSPPITVSGSEISNPGTPTTPTSSNNNNTSSSTSITINNNTITVNNNNINNGNPNTTPLRPAQVRSPYEWMKKSSYQSQPQPGKTRTKDKYRVVYTDHQRLELEKEFHYNRYITMRRKAELASNLDLSDRQVKIWFQNRRAKQRRLIKKREEQEQKDVKPSIERLSSSAMAAMNLEGIPHNAMAAMNLEGIPHNAMAALTLGGMAGMPGMGGIHNGMMHNDGLPPHGIGHQPHAH
ncbi:homeotic protein caudal [Lasioglossum baleicum]|uniref:homeotic protein caudal n=1 Tax=Lasioglossum baleicum TaxID=434251 RepID=UPI003FCECEBE